LGDKENNGHSLKAKEELQADFGNHLKSSNISLPLDQLSKTVTILSAGRNDAVDLAWDAVV
jgi:hypothetical protein